MNRPFAIGVTVGLLLAGCATATVGREFDPAAIARLTPGVSTTEDVRVVVGEPYARTILANGREEQWIYVTATATATVFSGTQSQGATSMVLRFRDGVLIE